MEAVARPIPELTLRRLEGIGCHLAVIPEDFKVERQEEFDHPHRLLLTQYRRYWARRRLKLANPGCQRR
jgi:hypothetical protein